MHFASSTLITALAIVNMAYAECHGSGESWGGEKFTALEAAQRLCSDGSLGNAYYGSQEFKTFCINLSSQKKADFTIQVRDSLVRPVLLGADECTENLQKEINGCDQGGRSTQEMLPPTSDTPEGEPFNPPSIDVDFSADPNAGQCA